MYTYTRNIHITTNMPNTRHKQGFFQGGGGGKGHSPPPLGSLWPPLGTGRSIQTYIVMHDSGLGMMIVPIQLSYKLYHDYIYIISVDASNQQLRARLPIYLCLCWKGKYIDLAHAHFATTCNNRDMGASPLRAEQKQFGVEAGRITDSTGQLYQEKMRKRKAESPACKQPDEGGKISPQVITSSCLRAVVEATQKPHLPLQ